MTIRQSTADDRSDRMDDIPRREIVPLRDLRRSRLLGMPLHLHQRSACRAQLQPRRRVNRIVNAAVTGDEAAEESRVGRVDDRVRRKARDVARASEATDGSAMTSTTPRASRSAESSSSCRARKSSESGRGGRTFISARKSRRCSSSDTPTSAACARYSGISVRSISFIF